MGKKKIAGFAAGAFIAAAAGHIWHYSRATGRRGLVTRAWAPLFVDLVKDLVTRPADDPEFAPPQWLAGSTNGELISATQMRALGLNSKENRGTMWRIEFATTDSQGNHLTSTGAVIRSENPWEGAGPRPVIGFAPGTQGTARHCDPSYAFTLFMDARWPFDIVSAYEQPAVNMFVAAGCHVVLTDYPRDPETGRQLYCDHVAGAHSLYDALRAASHLGITSERVGLYGFSQGGGAVAAALEEPDYAPDLPVVAAVCGAPPSDFDDILDHVEGKTATFVLPYALDGMMASHPEITDEVLPHMTDTAAELLELARNRCVLGGMPLTGRQDTTTWSKDGRTLAETVKALPKTYEILRSTRLGSTPPQIPTRLWATVHDDIIPYHSTQKLARDWGIDLVTRRLFPLLRFDVSNHLTPFFLWMHDDVNWLLDQIEQAEPAAR